MNSQQQAGQDVQDDRYSNLTPKEKPGMSPRDPIRNPTFPGKQEKIRRDAAYALLFSAFFIGN